VRDPGKQIARAEPDGLTSEDQLAYLVAAAPQRQRAACALVQIGRLPGCPAIAECAERAPETGRAQFLASVVCFIEKL
jgi:hypothetical protein